MPLFVQIDGNVVTGWVSSAGSVDATRLPPGRRFVQMADEATPPPPFSTVVLKGTDPIVVFDPAAVTFTDPVPVPLPPSAIDTKLDEILTEVKKGRDTKPVP